MWVAGLWDRPPTIGKPSAGVMLLAGPRLHPLWHTPLLPLLFLISCLTMGYAMVVFESSLASAFRVTSTGVPAGNSMRVMRKSVSALGKSSYFTSPPLSG